MNKCSENRLGGVEKVIEVQDVSKLYTIVEKDPGLAGAFKSLFVRKTRIHEAVKTLNFTINQGEMVAYIGANGAGKSTTIKLLCGILTPSTGVVRVNGIVPYENRTKNAYQIGAVFGQRSQLMWDLPVRESFELLRHVYNVPKLAFDEMLTKCTDVLQLEPFLGQPVRQLSLGQKMRCELAAAFLHRPSIVYLDEPTIGLDVAVKARIRQFIKEMNRTTKTTIILTSHDMQDIEELCERVILIDQGAIVYDGRISQLKSDYGQKRVVVFHCEPGSNWITPSELQGSVDVRFVEEQEPSQQDPSEHEMGWITVEVAFDQSTFSAREIITAVLAENAVHDLTVRESGIESIVRAIYERNGG